jgi:hypothetical protein
LTGEVPFKGVNGPSILLEILTTEPVPPSQASPSSRVDIPAGVDAAVLRALRKAVNQRTSSAGEFANDIGHAYGLDGDHRDWAVTTQHQLGRLIAARLPALMDEETLPRPARGSAEVRSLGSAGPHASPPSRTMAGGAAPLGSGPHARSPGVAPHFSLAPLPLDGPSSMSTRRPSWLAPVAVALAALVTGVVLTLLLL